MIDLDGALAGLVDAAPAPPAVDRVRRRGRARRRQRRAALATTVVVVATVAFAAIATAANHGTPRVAGTPTRIDHVRVTLLDGSQLEISGPSSLGLTHLEPVFNGSLDPVPTDSQNPFLIGHGFTITKSRPGDLGTVVGQYATADGHELVVHENPAGRGTQAVVQYGDWWLFSDSDGGADEWVGFASALNVARTADGSFVVVPSSGWRVGPTDAPDIALGGALFGSGAAFGFFGPAAKACPTPEQATGRTPQGWPVMIENGAWWCDGNAHVRIAVWDNQLVHPAIEGLRVSFTDAAQAGDRVTTLDGSTYEITAPSSVLDQLTLQAGLRVDGIDTPNAVRATPAVFPVSATRAGLPVGATSPTFDTGDGHRFSSYILPTECACEVLAGTYGPWLVEIEVGAMSSANRTRVASAFRAHLTADGFLVIDPAATMHLGSGPGAAIVLHGVDVSPGATPEIFVHDAARPLAAPVRVRRIG